MNFARCNLHGSTHIAAPTSATALACVAPGAPGCPGMPNICAPCYLIPSSVCSRFATELQPHICFLMSSRLSDVNGAGPCGATSGRMVAAWKRNESLDDQKSRKEEEEEQREKEINETWNEGDALDSRSLSGIRTKKAMTVKYHVTGNGKEKEE